ncbi:serine hydrolase domain-containing protein [Herbiconiux daphne]|uniref:Beta-lactamase family protein n=1 Tax=Herbiconiux daphne TaxID=2970914 RepID=A0ABT2H3B9_9MICO|nr:serine hydrolase domain-containing protein [Herbiconiux daphne]MCS5734438.1 beta-lactamase family protein [Herbiconiux daphne]
MSKNTAGRRRIAVGGALVALAATLLSGCTTGGSAASTTSAEPPGEPATSAAASGDEALAADVRDTITRAMRDWGMRAVIVRVTRGDQPVITEAFGESMTGVPATPDMHFRNGAVAISYVATALLELVDDGTVSLDDTLGTWLPDVPNADRVTLGQLAQMTSGYADYVADADFLDQLNADPFRQWQPDELAAYGTSKPLIYEPGTNWNYSHTNYVLLGLALEKITDEPMEQLLQERVLDPLGLDNTRPSSTAEIAEPVLHAFTAERREFLGIADGTPFLEESTFWNPSWTITRGAIQYTDIVDMTRTARAIGTGELLSPALHEKQLNLDTRGHSSTIEGCSTCFPHSEIYTYGIGVVMMGDWILQNPMFSGTAAVEAYLPDDDISLAVAVTFDESAFDDAGQVPNLATNLFRELAGVVAPGHAPPTR